PSSASPAATPVSDGGALIPVPPARPLQVRPAAVMPLSPNRYKLQLTIGGDTLEKLRLAKDMLGHAIPSGDDAAILDRALTALLLDLAKKRFADTRKPRPSRGMKAGPAIPRPLSSARSGCGIWDIAPLSEPMATGA